MEEKGPDRDTSDWQIWEREAISRLSTGIRSARTDSGMTQQQLADAIGVSKGQIANLESSTKGRVVNLPSIGTVIRLAAALETPVAQLLYPEQPYGRVEVIPGLMLDSVDAADWLTGAVATAGTATDRAERMRASRELRRLDKQLSKLHLFIGLGVSPEPGVPLDKEAAEREFQRLSEERQRLVKPMLERGWIEPAQAEPRQLIKKSAPETNG
jgi:transcriptional regulator with XRE-family HTH domain